MNLLKHFEIVILAFVCQGIVIPKPNIHINSIHLGQKNTHKSPT
jgi:hypothetical protein